MHLANFYIPFPIHNVIVDLYAQEICMQTKKNSPTISVHTFICLCFSQVKRNNANCNIIGVHLKPCTIVDFYMACISQPIREDYHLYLLIRLAGMCTPCRNLRKYKASGVPLIFSNLKHFTRNTGEIFT